MSNQAFDRSGSSGPSGPSGPQDPMEETRQTLAHLARLTMPIPPAHLMVGYLLAHAERVRFTPTLDTDAPLAMAFGVHRRIEVPLVPWEGFARGVPIPDPLLWIEAARSETRSPLSIRVSTDDRLLGALLARHFERRQAGDVRRQREDQVQRLRQQVDQTLDIYAELKRLLADPDREAEGHLPEFLVMAEEQMAHLSQELTALKGQMNLS
ncbi:MAG: hypothetical protein M0Z54_00935 [Thermaerobacter sp.]|nr:hypothetical protein [Thermaerobacter sp.]